MLLPHQRKGYFVNSQSRMSNALLRAREPYWKKNVLFGGILFAFFGGSLLYTFKTILSSDEFQDIPIPPIEEEDLKRLRAEYEEKKRQKNLNGATELKPFEK
ncbi:hypothetical protein QEN19_003218 [Hanseniaspora menglaensis]